MSPVTAFTAFTAFMAFTARARRASPLLAFVASSALACGSALPPPPLAAPPDDAYSEVPYPPPPAQIEFVPERPSGDVAWVDGVWIWEGNRWRWSKGGWVKLSPGAVYSLWQTKRAPDGRLLFATAAWRTPDGKPAPAPPLVAPATSGPPSTTEP